MEIVSGNKKLIYSENYRTRLRSAHGKSTEKIMCPFCKTETVAYTWSLSGCGKKCDTCIDTLHMATGSVMRFKNESDAIKYLKEHKKWKRN